MHCMAGTGLGGSAHSTTSAARRSAARAAMRRTASWAGSLLVDGRLRLANSACVPPKRTR